VLVEASSMILEKFLKEVVLRPPCIMLSPLFNFLPIKKVGIYPECFIYIGS
jgi:hypothetical protein